LNNKILNLYKKLLKENGEPKGQWSVWAKRPKTTREREQIVIEAILTQRTNWKNVQIAMKNLRRVRADSLRGIYNLKSAARLAPLIKSSGFYRQKSAYLFDLAKWIIDKYGGLEDVQKEPLGVLREKLLAQKGVGPETADSILLYALDKPVFVIDEYTRRLLRAKSIAQRTKYEELRALFEKNLPRNWRLYQDFHALIVIEGKTE